mgnify:FL=1
MILIDSLYINNSGGLRLLEYLVRELCKRQTDFYLLADARCRGKFDECEHVRYMPASLWERKKFYKAQYSRFSSVLCFGNIPAPVKMDVPVYTYFHNINLLTLAETHSNAHKIKSWLKREVFRFYKKNTDYWLVQTSNTANELVKHLDEKAERVMLMPFYELPQELSSLANDPHGDDYVYISNYTGAKGHEELLEAWMILHGKGLYNTLHLTVPEDCPFAIEVKKAHDNGVKVINHGFVAFEEVCELYKKSKAIIYPSHNESLGLGIIEAITAGCDVIGADLPYIYAICKPSLAFNPYSADSIANAVQKYEKGGTNKSELKVYNQISKMIDLLTVRN